MLNLNGYGSAAAPALRMLAWGGPVHLGPRFSALLASHGGAPAASYLASQGLRIRYGSSAFCAGVDLPVHSRATLLCSPGPGRTVGELACSAPGLPRAACLQHDPLSLLSVLPSYPSASLPLLSSAGSPAYLLSAPGASAVLSERVSAPLAILHLPCCGHLSGSKTISSSAPLPCLGPCTRVPLRTARHRQRLLTK